VTVYTGKVELGTGVATALAQVVAEELDVPVARITMVEGDTARTPDQGQTTGSLTIQHGAPALRAAAAAARATLFELASRRLGVAVDRLAVTDGVVAAVTSGGGRVTYGELVGGARFARRVDGGSPKPPEQYRVVGTPVPRIDLPDKVTGRYVNVHDVRMPGMLHGRVVRPPAPGARLVSVDEASVRGLPGLVRVVHRRDFVAVVAEREEQAAAAARTLAVAWRRRPEAPDVSDLHAWMRAQTTAAHTIRRHGDVEAALGAAAHRVDAVYRWPFQMHASIGPSCAVADVTPAATTVWAATQGSWGLRSAIARLLGVPDERVRVIYVEASGCFGHNGADDAAADAALLSQAVGRPVRVQWTREDEHGWEPKGPAMVMQVRGGVDVSGRIVAWDYAAWTPTHSTRPRGQPGNLLAGQLTGSAPRYPSIGGGRNAAHPYDVADERVVLHPLADSPLRTSGLRGLAAPQNTFANESFADELAAAVGADPVAFRLEHLRDPRAVAVVREVARLARWQSRPSPRPRRADEAVAAGRGAAYVRYDGAGAHVATVAEVEVDRASGTVRVRRVFAAHDCGLVVNPDGVRNQVEGAVVQSISRTLKEEVRFDRAGVSSLDWSTYPILTFAEVPDTIEVALIDRRDEPSLGAGEPAACPVAPAIANAVFDATGVRLRTVPFTPARVLAALAAGP
jgi:nicotinate dehydrogenase subunit B